MSDQEKCQTLRSIAGTAIVIDEDAGMAGHGALPLGRCGCYFSLSSWA